MSEAAAAQAETAPEKQEEPYWKFFLKLMAVVLIFRTFFFAPFTIPSESMLPGLLNGDYIVASKWDYGFTRHSLPFSLPLIPGRIMASEPDRGDVAIFRAPPGESEDYIKRIVGLPGDQVEMRAGVLFLNGEAVEKRAIEPFVLPVSPNTACVDEAFRARTADGGEACSYPQFLETLPDGGPSYRVLDLAQSPQDDFGPVIVPEGSVFLMGDNRDNSMDSRFPATPGGGIGIVEQRLLIGQARFVAFSSDGGAEWIKPWTWFTAARWNRIGDGI